MFRTLLLLFAAAGLHARPLQKDALQFQNGGWVLNAPQPVQDQYKDELKWEVVLAPNNEAKVRDDSSRKSVPTEDRRQGTEPSRRFLVDLNTGMLKEHSEMDRRVSGYYNYPSNYEFRQGTQNSQATLVDMRIGQPLPPGTEMQRKTTPLEGLKKGIEYSQATLMTLRKAKMDPTSTEVSQDDAVAKDTTRGRVLPELQRQGTEPSRRFLMDLNTGMLKEHSEMDRRVSGFYNYPSNYGFRQGTQNSQATLVDARTGQQHEQLSEMERSAVLSDDRRGAVNSRGISKELQNNHIIENTEEVADFRIGTDDSQAQSTHLHQLKSLENNEVIISSVIEGPSHPKEFRHGMEDIHTNLIDDHIMKPAETRESVGEEVAVCQGMIVGGKCYYVIRNV